MVSITSVEAQNRFLQLLDTVKHEPVGITRDGQAAAFVVSPQDMDELLELRDRRRRAGIAFTEWTDQARERLTPDAAELTDDDINRMVHELR